MSRRATARSSILGVLATYAVACFVVLQLLDIVMEPLGLPLGAIRWVMLGMIAVAPLLVIAVAWRSHRQVEVPDAAGTEVGRDVVFRIAHAELDTAQRQLRFGGEPVDVQPKVFDLVEYLVRARDRVVSKDELFDEIWPAVVVSESSLTQTIKRARDLFRQNGVEQDIIRTVARKGYQFDVPVGIAALSDDHGLPIWRDFVLPATTVGVIAVVLGALVWSSDGERARPVPSGASDNSLVVLPFRNMTPDQEFSYFSNGLTETLTNALTTVRDLRVIARGSASSFQDADLDYSVIADEFQIAYVVEGSVQRSGTEIRISTRLIRAADGEQVWSRIYNRALDNMFDIQDEIAQSVVEQMGALMATELSLPEYRGEITATAEDSAAYRLYLLGQDKRRSASANNLQAAEADFREALRLRPDYPEAMVALADAIRVRATLGELPREPTYAEALTLINRALELDPESGEAYLQLGEIQHRHFWDFEAAAESYAQALDLQPGSAGVRSAYSRFLSKAGRFDEAIREAKIAQDLNPRSTRAATSLAIRQIRARDLDGAREVIDALAAEHPEHYDVPWLETNWHIRNGSYRDALASVALEELDYLRLSLSAIALYHLGRVEQAEEALDELIETDADGAAFQIAEVFAQWGDADAAFEWLERAFSHGDPGMAELYSSVNLDNLHGDPRFPALAERIGLPPLP